MIQLFNELTIGCKNKYKHVSTLANNKYGIEISAKGVKRWVDKWLKDKKLSDQLRSNKAKLLISNAGMLVLNQALLVNPSFTLRKGVLLFKGSFRRVFIKEFLLFGSWVRLL